jgi:hypothetical protein
MRNPVSKTAANSGICERRELNSLCAEQGIFSREQGIYSPLCPGAGKSREGVRQKQLSPECQRPLVAATLVSARLSIFDRPREPRRVRHVGLASNPDKGALAMRETQISGPETRTSTNSAEEAAAKMARDAETRSASGAERRRLEDQEARSQAAASPARSSPPLADNPAPLSSALGIPTLLNETKPAGEAPAQPDEPRRGDDRATRNRRASETDADFYVSSELGIPLLSENPTPLSSVLGIPTLLNESKPSPRR